MERFMQLFADFLGLVYHCFDRIVINGYLSGLSRPEQVVYFFRQVLGIPVVSKEILSQRTDDYRNWVEAYARNHKIPMEWAEKGTRKENHVPACVAPHGEEERLWCLLHLQKHGAGPDLPHQRAQVPHARSQPPHPGAPTEPLHPLLLLYPGCGPGAHHRARGQLLSLPCYLLAQRPLFHRTGTEAKANRLPQNR